jgi:nucleoside-diphosphate-sugar epimerase
MKVLVTGSAGHLGEALVRVLRDIGYEVAGLDVLPSPFTNAPGSLLDPAHVRRCTEGASTVFHAATLHKPHVGVRSDREFIDVNVMGTLNLLEQATAAGVRSFVFTSTTSAFGRALTPPDDAPAAWGTEDLVPVPRNIYGVTKKAAEDLCELAHRDRGLPCIVLRTSRFFPEADDDDAVRREYADGNVKANEYLYRRVDLEDVVQAHLLAQERAPAIGFGRYVVSATTPFLQSDLPALRTAAPDVLRARVPEYEAEYARRGWKMFPGIDRVYVNERARRELGWQPRYDFRHVLERLRDDDDPRSPLARLVGSKGYGKR